jgi:hypothetical protein
MPYPEFLQRQKKHTSKRMLKNVVSDYNPLLGAWLIDMALMLNWYKLTRRNGWAEIFECDNFCALAGLSPHDEYDDDEDDAPKRRPTSAHSKNILKKQLKELQEIEISAHLFWGKRGCRPETSFELHTIWNISIPMLTFRGSLQDSNNALMAHSASTVLQAQGKANWRATSQMKSASRSLFDGARIYWTSTSVNPRKTLPTCSLWLGSKMPFWFLMKPTASLQIGETHREAGK